MTRSFSPLDLRRWLARIVTLALCLLGQGGFAADPGVIRFNIPSDVAAKSLKIFAHQSGSEVIIGSEQDGQVLTRAVKGEMTPPEALARMLARTGLVADRHEKTGAYAVRREKAEKNDQRAAQKAPSDRPTNPGIPRISNHLQL